MANRAKKVRMCVSCRRAYPREEMLRIVRSPSGEIGTDENGNADGRGAYLCSDKGCYERAVRERRLERALRHKVPEEVYEKIGEHYA